MQHSNMARMQRFGSDFWNDSCELNELRHAVAEGAVGATSNPVITVAAIEKDRQRWSAEIDRLIGEHATASEDELVWLTMAQLGLAAAKELQGVYATSRGQKGKLSLQVSPLLYRNSARMVEQGLELAGLAPNIAVKVPALASGLPVLEELTSRGVSVNATVSFTVSQALACAEAIERGLGKASKAQTDSITPCVTVMVGRVDDYLEQLAVERGLLLEPGLTAWAGIAVIKKAYTIFQQRGYRARLLAAAYRHPLHWTELVGGDLILSMPYAWWTRFNASDTEVIPKMGLAVDDRILAQLSRQFPEFRQAYQDDGLLAPSFARYGAARKTLKQFMQGFDQLRGLIRERLLVS